MKSRENTHEGVALMSLGPPRVLNSGTPVLVGQERGTLDTKEELWCRRFTLGSTRIRVYQRHVHVWTCRDITPLLDTIFICSSPCTESLACSASDSEDLCVEKC